MSQAPASASSTPPQRVRSDANASAERADTESPRTVSWFGRTRARSSARATGSAIRSTSALYRPSTAGALAVQRTGDGLAQRGHARGRLDLGARGVAHVEYVERLVTIGGDL